MNMITPCHVFIDHDCVYKGTVIEAGLFVFQQFMTGENKNMLTFNDETGKLVDFDFSQGKKGMINALMQQSTIQPMTGNLPIQQEGHIPLTPDADEQHSSRGRGRPKLGVVSKEVTLLPRHWDWLNAQAAGASATLRRLVEHARKAESGKTQQEQAIDAAYQVMHALAGNLQNFEEASRALFAVDEQKFMQQIESWPEDVKSYLGLLAFGHAESGI